MCVTTVIILWNSISRQIANPLGVLRVEARRLPIARAILKSALIKVDQVCPVVPLDPNKMRCGHPGGWVGGVTTLITLTSSSHNI